MEDGEWARKCTRQAGNECGHRNLKFANMGLKAETSQPLITRKIINVIILRPRKI